MWANYVPGLMPCKPPARVVRRELLRRENNGARPGSTPVPSTNFRADGSTDQNSRPTPNTCGFNSRTAHLAGLARRRSRAGESCPNYGRNQEPRRLKICVWVPAERFLVRANHADIALADGLRDFARSACGLLRLAFFRRAAVGVRLCPAGDVVGLLRT